MAMVEDIVIVGAGIGGLATSLALHRLGIKSVVLEGANSLRTTGFALGMWTNGLKALDAIGVGDILREKHNRLDSAVTTSVNSEIRTSELPLRGVMDSSGGDHEMWCVVRKVLLEILENELPSDSIRYSSKVVHVEIDGCFKSLRLSNGTVLKTKVLIGCDGVNSVVAKYLGFSDPPFVGRSSARGLAYFENGHGIEPKLMGFFEKDVHYGFIPCNDNEVFWFFTFSPSSQEKEGLKDPAKLKQLILSKLGKVSVETKQMIEKTKLMNMLCSPIRFRHPWELLWGNISKDNVCVIGDALHPMTPEMAQGGSLALEDSIILARLLAKALKGNEEEDEEQERIKNAMEKFAMERRWRSIELITTSYMIGFMQRNGVVMQFLRERFLGKFMAGAFFKTASFDCGNLCSS